MQITLTELDLSSLEQLGDGAAVALVTRLLEEAHDDMERRPLDKGARTVKVHLVMTPKVRLEPIDERTNRAVLDGVDLSIEMDLTKPKRKTLKYDLGIGSGGKLVFNPESPFNHRQAQLPMSLDAPATVSMSG